MSREYAARIAKLEKQNHDMKVLLRDAERDLQSWMYRGHAADEHTRYGSRGLCERINRFLHDDTDRHADQRVEARDSASETVLPTSGRQREDDTGESGRVHQAHGGRSEDTGLGPASDVLTRRALQAGRDLMAIVHGDDGSYREQHGDRKAADDAIEIVGRLKVGQMALHEASETLHGKHHNDQGEAYDAALKLIDAALMEAK